MVRTLDFQFENVGSNPASPTMRNQLLKTNEHLLINLSKEQKKKEMPSFLKYSVSFVSLVSPLSFKKTHFNSTYSQKLNKTNNKALFKKSYTILTWFYYLTFVSLKKNKKININVFVKPKKKKIFTSLKAPMAHKNNSKEQYKFLFYSYTVSFKSNFDKNEAITNNSVIKNYLFFWTVKKQLLPFDTNVFFLKSCSFFSTCNDPLFFKIK